MFKIRRTRLSLGLLALASLVALGIPQGGSKADTTTATAAATSTPQQQIDQNNQQIANLNAEIATYQAELQQVGANKKTLQAAINSLDLQRNKIQAQVALTQAQISITQLQITQLGADISDTQQTILNDQAAVGDNLRTIQKADGEPLFMQILSAGDFAQIWDNVNATLETQNAIQQKLDLLQTQKQSLANSQMASKQKQVTLGSQQQSLTAQQQSLIATEQSKSQLLVETNAEESTYEKLLAAAQAELASFSTFAQNAGGSKLLGNQTQCDSWGCYYNQRDTAWGNDALDGTQYRLASDGCLVTSMAMVMTHYGYRDVTPVTINSNPANFATYYPAYLLLSINVDGVTATRKTATIDATLATGNPVIVGLNAYGGTHYVVLVSGSNGNYIMRDPYVANGKDISFSSQYKLRSIFGISRVQITT
jgi:peptidoglycan hydrolase CwlO-like protein